MVVAEVVELLDSDDEEVVTPAPRQAAAPSQAAAASRAADAHQEAGPSEAGADDGCVAQLVDMGFTPEQAASVRQPAVALLDVSPNMILAFASQVPSVCLLYATFSSIQ